MEGAPPPSVPPTTQENGATTQTLAVTWPWSHHGILPSVHIQLASAVDPASKNQNHSLLAIHTAATRSGPPAPHAQAAAQPPSAARASPHTPACASTLVQPWSLTASALLPLAASCSSHHSALYSVFKTKGPHCILGSEGLGFNSSSSGRSSWRLRLG